MKDSYADVLESYLIAEEGLISKVKEKINKRKAEKEAKEKEREERIRIFKEEYPKSLALVDSACNKVIARAKSKYKNLPYNVKFFKEDRENGFDIEIFEDEWCMNEFSEKYNPEAEKCFDYIYNEIKNMVVNINKKFNVCNCEVDVYENNIITIYIN